MEVTRYMKEIKIKEKRATSRMGHLPISGGGLNASYTTVDAVGSPSGGLSGDICCHRIGPHSNDAGTLAA